MMTINEDGLDAAQQWFAERLEDSPEDGHNPEVISKGMIEAYFDNIPDMRMRLRDGRGPGHIEGTTTKFEVGGVEGYITVNCFPNGQPAEIFLHDIGKEGSTINGFMRLVAILFSVGLQYGVPLKTMTQFLIGMKFEPSDTEADSIPDWIGKHLEGKYGDA